MDCVCDLLTQLFRQYGTQYFDLRDICYWAAVEENSSPGTFNRCMAAMDKFGGLVLDLYESLLQAYENGTPEVLEGADFLARHQDFERRMFAIIDTWGGLVPCIRNRTNRELE